LLFSSDLRKFLTGLKSEGPPPCLKQLSFGEVAIAFEIASAGQMNVLNKEKEEEL